MDIQYSAFYIYGLRQVFGRDNVCFAGKSQMDLFFKSNINLFSFLVSENDNSTGFTRIVIDHSDFNYLYDEEIYKWADIYGKINTNREITPFDAYPKMVCLASNFGLRCFGLTESIEIALSNFVKVKPLKKKKFLSQYIKQNKKLWLKEYPLSQSSNGYVFSLNTLWHSDEWNRLDETTNRIRAGFMEICRSLPGIRFEGGFVSSGLGNQNFKHLQCKNRVSHREYIDKLSKSVIAFNTPAVWGCHGWKLSEFLCMGKAIISTPLSNDLPAPLVHGEAVHFIENMDELPEAVLLLNNDVEYRKKLEHGSSAYYEKYVSPEAVIRLLGI